MQESKLFILVLLIGTATLGFCYVAHEDDVANPEKQEPPSDSQLATVSEPVIEAANEGGSVPAQPIASTDETKKVPVTSSNVPQNGQHVVTQQRAPDGSVLTTHRFSGPITAEQLKSFGFGFGVGPAAAPNYFGFPFFHHPQQFGGPPGPPPA